jgi:hypothetical protein
MGKYPPRNAGRVRRPWKYEMLLVPLPVAGAIGSFAPLWFVALALARLLGIAAHAPVKDQRFGLLWFVLFLLTMVAFSLLGMVLGLCLNLLILRRVFGWAWIDIRDAGALPIWLDRWMQGGATPLQSDHAECDGDPLYDRDLDGADGNVSDRA